MQWSCWASSLGHLVWIYLWTRNKLCSECFLLVVVLRVSLEMSVVLPRLIPKAVFLRFLCRNLYFGVITENFLAIFLPNCCRKLEICKFFELGNLAARFCSWKCGHWGPSNTEGQKCGSVELWQIKCCLEGTQVNSCSAFRRNENLSFSSPW